MPKKFEGRPKGSKNKIRTPLPATEAMKILEEQVAQTVATTAQILGTSEGAVYRDINDRKLSAFRVGKLWRVPSVVIRQRLFPQTA